MAIKLLFILTLCSLACSLSNRQVEPRTVVVTSSDATDSPATTALAATQANPNPTQETSSSTQCTPRTDWTLYTVVAGDTLGTIAERVGSTTAALAQANCLTNLDLVSVGQPLRVPVLPAPPNPQPVSRSLTINPTYDDNGGWLIVAPGSTVTITWAGLPASVSKVDFYIIPPGTGTFDARTSMGIDTNLADGASVTWAIPAEGVMAHIEAAAYLANGSLFMSSSSIQIYAQP